MTRYDPNVPVRTRSLTTERDTAPHLSPAALSPRQLACLHRVAAGESSSEIARTFGLSVRTVDQYVAEACARLGVRKRTSAVAKALGLGLLQLAAAER